MCSMDVSKPELIWLDGRCYRLNFQDSSFREKEEGQFVDDGCGEESMLSTRLKIYIFSYFVFSVNVHAYCACRGLLLYPSCSVIQGHCILVTDV